jgi:hypothetical protein
VLVSGRCQGDLARRQTGRGILAWSRVPLTEEPQRIVHQERTSHPDLRVREKMLVLWSLYCGTTRPKAADIVGLGRATVPRYVVAFRQGAWIACGGVTTMARSARWPPIAS